MTAPSEKRVVLRQGQRIAFARLLIRRGRKHQLGIRPVHRLQQLAAEQVLMPMIWRSRATLVLLLATATAVGAFTPLEARQWGPSAGETTPAQKAGWWVRINPANQATRVYWRFGGAPSQLSAPMTWVQGASPEALDAPNDQRLIGRVHIAALGLPPAAPVSFCLFFQDRGVILVEFTQETTLEVDQAQSDERCVP